VTRPPFEVADITRQYGTRFIETHRAWLTAQHRRVLRAIAHCRTAALGAHLDRCTACGHRAISFNSCRDRHCPKCLTHARDQWLAERERELLPVGYAHVVFTLPHALAGLALHNKRAVYDLLFQASAATLLEVARTPKHLGAALGFLSVLHTWGADALAPPARALRGARGRSLAPRDAVGACAPSPLVAPSCAGSRSIESYRLSRVTKLPAIGVGLQMRPDALPCQRFLSEPRNDVQVGVEHFLPADAPAVPTNVVSAG